MLQPGQQGSQFEPTTDNQNLKQHIKIMGDRGNIAVIQSETDQVWFYTHWSGSEIKKTTGRALRRGKERWNDVTYLARIIFSELVPAEDREEETGYGISCRIGDNEHPIVVVDMPKERVFHIQEKELKDGKVPADYKPSEAWTFGDYIRRHAGHN